MSWSVNHTSTVEVANVYPVDMRRVAQIGYLGHKSWSFNRLSGAITHVRSVGCVLHKQFIVTRPFTWREILHVSEHGCLRGRIMQADYARVTRVNLVRIPDGHAGYTMVGTAAVLWSPVEVIYGPVLFMRPESTRRGSYSGRRLLSDVTLPRHQ